MTTTAATTASPWDAFPEQLIKRDRWGRPLIIPPGGGKAVPYTRVSTLAKALDDQAGLMKWMKRQVSLGLARRPDLVALLQSTDANDSRALDEICEQAMSAAGSGAAANIGTAVHSFTEQVDRGNNVISDLPAEYTDVIDAYRRATAVLSCELIESFVVVDRLEAAGTMDRLYRLPDGSLCVGDIKTGREAWKYPNAVAAQLALYAHGAHYDAQTGKRTPLPDAVSQDFGLLIHLPVDDSSRGTCAVYKVDIAFGWVLAQAGCEVRDWRKRKGVATFAWDAK